MQDALIFLWKVFKSLLQVVSYNSRVLYNSLKCLTVSWKQSWKLMNIVNYDENDTMWMTSVKPQFIVESFLKLKAPHIIYSLELFINQYYDQKRFSFFSVNIKQRTLQAKCLLRVWNYVLNEWLRRIYCSYCLKVSTA